MAWKRLIVALSIGVIVCAPNLDGQENSKTLDKLVRDQEMIRLRLERIEEMMGRLMRKYEAEGGRRNADLILKARQQLKERDIYGRLETVEALLGERRLQVVEEQRALSEDLADIFAILQDRSDLERLQEMLASLEEGISKTAELAREQERILSETRQLNHNADEFLRQALNQVKGLLKKQKALSGATRRAAEKEAEAQSLLDLARSLDALADRQGALVQKTLDAISERAGAAAEQLEQAVREQESLSRRLEKLADETGEKDHSEQRLNEFLRQQIAASESLRAAAEALAAGEKERSAQKSAQESLRAAAAKMAETERAIDEGRIDDAIRGAKEAAQNARSALEKLGEGGDGRLAEEQEKIAEEAEALREEMGAKAESEQARPEASKMKSAMEKLSEATGAARDAGQSLKEGCDANAMAQEQKAERNLREAADEMRRAWQKGIGKRREETGRQADEQNALSRETRDLNKKLEAAEDLLAAKDEADSEGNLAQEKRKAAEAAEKMSRAEGQLRQSAPQPAGAEQAQAESALQDLAEMLEKKTAEAAAQKSDSMSPEEKASKYDELAGQQKELEERTRDLMKRLRELPDKKPLSSLSQAADNMNSASSELDNQQGDMAEQDEEDAQKYLERALQQMKQEKQKYQSIQQQEVLFRVLQELEELKKEQDSINTTTVDFDLERAGSPSLRRSQKKKLRDLAGREDSIRDRTVTVKEKIEEDGSTVFNWVLDRNRDDLDEVVEALKQYQSDAVVQTIQKDISVRFEELIASMREEIKRRQNAPTGEPQESPNAQPPLIPPVAELIMIKTMEEGAQRRLEEFIIDNPDIDEKGANPIERELLKRLASEHAAITELFQEILTRFQSEAQSGEKK